ncbi:alpha-ketoacid dehydrogenase subunit beta, partial [Azospirillum brasilense]|nr:alpha-ketoacid dehydrogenase subunit beta [Azospirillum brasilense]
MSRKISMKTAINEALDLEMRRDPTVILMGEDIVGGTGRPGEADAGAGCLGAPKGRWPRTGARLR